MMKAHRGGRGEVLEDVDKAIEIVKSWKEDRNMRIHPEAIVPKELLENCHGLVFLYFMKVGVLISGSGGSGFVIAKLNKGTSDVHWSAPSAIACGAVGLGAQVIGEMVHNVLVLNTAEAVEKFYSQAKLKVGVDLTVAAGFDGGNRVEAGIDEMLSAEMTTFSYSKGGGIGFSVEGTVLGVSNDVNKEFYGKSVTAKDILTGAMDEDLNSKYPTLQDLYGQITLYKNSDF
eukprot:CAMPEP_0174913996 /NCGR_PEP_ID=MMETSP0167-20121228/80611_1 /TAXON_ID=38298 /ORGANISM="Rhodella maculata, Strain CCMP736" /LENGTH=229 /DNA_ID=CAMNT_0016158741 /DNA_START=77 /DNA_END=766 /DNA_ORIENTATION=+